MVKSGSSNEKLNKTLSLLKVELVKKKSKLEKQKRYLARKNRLELLNSTDNSDLTTRSVVSVKNVKHNDVQIVSNATQETPCDEIPSARPLESQELLKLSRNSDKDKVNDIVTVRVTSENGDNVKTMYIDKTCNDLVNKMYCSNNLSESVSKPEPNSKELENEIQTVFSESEKAKMCIDILMKNMKCIHKDLYNNTTDSNLCLAIKSVGLTIENGRVLFCDYANETLLVIQQNVLSIFVKEENGNWSVVHEYLRKVNHCFCGGHFNIKENIFIELNKSCDCSCFVEFHLVQYSTSDKLERSMLISTLPKHAEVISQCFSDQHIAICYQLETETNIILSDIKKSKINVGVNCRIITFITFLNIYSGESLLVCFGIGECFLYNICGVLLQSYVIPFLTHNCLLGRIEKNILFMVFENKTEEKFILAALNILTKRHRILQTYSLPIQSVSESTVFIRNSLLVAMNKKKLTFWDIKTGCKSSSWTLPESEVIFCNRDLIFTISSKGDNLSLFSLL